MREIRTMTEGKGWGKKGGGREEGKGGKGGSEGVGRKGREI